MTKRKDTEIGARYPNIFLTSEGGTAGKEARQCGLNLVVYECKGVTRRAKPEIPKFYSVMIFERETDSEAGDG